MLGKLFGVICLVLGLTIGKNTLGQAPLKKQTINEVF